jgi:23S rRNA pseudoU1915 N3-methylase RlmH
VKEEGKRDLAALQKRVEENFERQITEYQKKAQSDAERNISEIERNIQVQNHLLEDHAEMQQDEMDHTEGVAKRLEAENGQYRADLASKERAVEEFARKQYEQNSKIRMLRGKIELLERRLSEIVANFEKEKELLRFQSEQVIKDQSEEVRGLRESIRLRTREVKNLKALC